MTDKEKLVELITKARVTRTDHSIIFHGDDAVADYLIAHGVTVQRWIPVTERLPDTQEYDWVLVNIRLMPEDYDGVPCVAELRNGDWYDDEGRLLDTDAHGFGVIVTHWMPLPDPPEGE